MEFAYDFPSEFKLWHDHSNSIITLALESEQELIDFTCKLDSKGLKYSKSIEPDIGDKLTAIAIVPHKDVRKLCSSKPLAGKFIKPGSEERLKELLAAYKQKPLEAKV